MTTVLRVGVWCMTTLVLVDCAGLSHRYYSAIARTNWSIHTAQSIGTKSSYTVISTSFLGKFSPLARARPKSLVSISRGEYKSWRWSIQATPKVADSWHQWLSREARLDGAGPPMKFNWRYGFSRLWTLISGLTGKSPLPMSLKLTLIPRYTDYHLVIKRTSGFAVPLDAAFWYTASRETGPVAAVERFHDYAHVLSVIGGLLVQVEAARGLLPGPVSKAARRIKDAADATCVDAVGLPFLARGTDRHLIIIGPPIFLSGRLYAEHPTSLLAKELFEQKVILGGLYKYLEHEGLQWPATGHNVFGINALLRYCRAFVDYPADVRKHTMPLSYIKSFSAFTQ